MSAPERIWLEPPVAGRAFVVGGSAPDRFPGDVEYVRGDIAAARLAEVEAQRQNRALQAQVDHLRETVETIASAREDANEATRSYARSRLARLDDIEMPALARKSEGADDAG